MSKRRNTTEIPDKNSYTVAETAIFLARHTDARAHTAKVRLYRAIENGSVEAIRYLGGLRIPKSEVQRILRGEFI